MLAYGYEVEGSPEALADVSENLKDKIFIAAPLFVCRLFWCHCGPDPQFLHIF